MLYKNLKHSCALDINSLSIGRVKDVHYQYSCASEIYGFTIRREIVTCVVVPVHGIVYV